MDDGRRATKLLIAVFQTGSLTVCHLYITPLKKNGTVVHLARMRDTAYPRPPRTRLGDREYGSPSSRPAVVPPQPADGGGTFFFSVQEERSTSQTGGGNRAVTVLIYLNSVRKGGETSFDLADVLPVTGKAVVFFACHNDGTPDERLHHAARPPSGVKWVSQVWVRQREYVSEGEDVSGEEESW